MKVLIIIDGKSFGGICKLFTDIEKNIPKDIEFDYLTATHIDKRFYSLNVNRTSITGRIKFNYKLYKFLKKHKYDIVHINSGAFFFTFFCAIVCRLKKVKRIVVHSHNTHKLSLLKKLLIKVLNPLYRRITNCHLSCSFDASKSLFTKTGSVIILNNGVVTSKFRYNKKIRNDYRKKFLFENKIVYGHVGRFDKEKNHDFLVSLFYEIQKEQDAILLLIGTGKLQKSIEEKVRKLKIEDKVVFMGYRKDISNLMNAMDVFLFPSIHEGFPVSVIESLSSGLPTYVSDAITDEAKISSNFHKINSLDINEWKKIVLDTKFNDRTNEYKVIAKQGYDIKDTTKKLEKIYRDLMK